MKSWPNVFRAGIAAAAVFLLAPSATWRISRDTKLNVNAYYQKDPALVPSTPLPATGTLRPAPYGELDSDAYAGDVNWAGMSRTVKMAGWKFEHAFGNGVTFLQNVRWTKADGFQRNTYNYGLQADGRTLIRSAYFTDEQQDGWVADNQLAFRTTTGPITHRLLAGVDYQKMDSHVRYGDTLSTDTPTIDLGNPDWHLLDPSRLPFDTYTERHDIGQSQLGWYAQDEAQWGPVTVIAGPPGVTASVRTTISFSVSVPVLSVQMTDTAPSVSTAGSRRTMALRSAIRWTPSASVMVSTAGSPSGIAETAMPTMAMKAASAA